MWKSGKLLSLILVLTVLICKVKLESILEETKSPAVPSSQGVKDLLLHVTNDGKHIEQMVDNQQGQVVMQTVDPEGGIRQTVFRNGQVIADDVVKAPRT